MKISMFGKSINTLVFILGLLFFPLTIVAKLTPTEQNGLWGYVDHNGKWRIKPTYHYAGEFNEGLACVMNYYNHNSSIVKLYGYINEKGKFVIPQKYNYGSDFNNGLAVVGMWKGITSIRKHRSSIDGLKNDLAEVFLIDKAGESYEFFDAPHYIEITNSDSIRIYRLKDGRLFTQNIDRLSIIDTSIPEGQIKDSNSSKDIIAFSGQDLDYPIVLSNLMGINSIDTSHFRWGENMSIIEDKSNQILPLIKYKSVPPSKNVVVHPSDTLGMWGFKNTKGNWVIPAKYDYIETYAHLFNDSTSDVKSIIENFKVHGYGGWGVVDSIGNVILEPQFNAIEFYNKYKYSPSTKCYYYHPDIYIGVQKNNLWGVTDYKGRYIITPTYESIERLTPEVIHDSIPFYKTTKNRKMGLLNSYFKELIPPIIEGYSLKYNRKYNIVQYKSDDRDIFCDTLGNFLFSAKEIKSVSDPDRFIFRNEGGWGVANRKGEIIVQDSCGNIDMSYGLYFILHNKNSGDRIVDRFGEDVLKFPIYKVKYVLGEGIFEVQKHEDSPILEYYNSAGEQLCYNDGTPIISEINSSHGRYYIGDYKSIVTPLGYVFVHGTTGDIFGNKIYYQILSSKGPDLTTTALFYNSEGETMMDIINYKTGEIIYSGYYDGRE